jgi:membrane-associated phospholipid phosphatase
VQVKKSGYTCVPLFKIKNTHMKKLLFLILSITTSVYASAQVEAGAGKWKTWFVQPAAYRLPSPSVVKNEIQQVIAAQQKINEGMMQQIHYWSAGSPGYRWQQFMDEAWMSEAMKEGILANMLMSVAVYDATVAAWDTKYLYNTARPFVTDKRIKCYVPKPESPSYPCEHSVTAGVASTILAHFFPKMADSVKRMAQQQMTARIAAGAAYPSDTKAGFELGKKIALAAIERTRGYLNYTPWDGKLPKGEKLWNGKFALFANAGKSKTIALDSASQFRPGPPPDFEKEMQELKNYKQTHSSMATAFYHDSRGSWSEELNKKIFEYNIHLNPPLAAKLYALTAIGLYDGFVSCFDAKYTYWGIRPEQYDISFKPLLFESPPFPGYPSGHAAVSSVMAELFASFFPADAAYFRDRAREVAESRFQGGIHFRTDNEVALDLGRKVAMQILKKAKG